MGVHLVGIATMGMEEAEGHLSHAVTGYLLTPSSFNEAFYFQCSRASAAHRKL